MSHAQPQPNRPADLGDAEVPAGLLAYEIGLSPQRFRELIAHGDDAYTRRQEAGARA